MSADSKASAAKIEEIGSAALREIQHCSDVAALEELRVRHLGKKSEFSKFMRQIGELPPEVRKEVGEAANSVKSHVDWALAERKNALDAVHRDRRLIEEKLDVTLPGRPLALGHPHPLSLILEEIEEIFTAMGFEIASGPDVEDEFHNFAALNFPPEHPARDMHDTFYMRGGGLLRTHTSPVQIRTMQRRQAPLAVIAPGRVYRTDADLTHSPMFHQVEGFLVDTKVRFSDLKGVLGAFLHRMMGDDVRYRFRPSYFPFTEPSAEVDIIWKAPGREPAWLEVLGAGMIHPKVLEAGGHDPAKISGFAFGMGVERFAMLKYGIPNINLFWENDLRFLERF